MSTTLYQLVSADPSPVDLASMKSYLRVTNTADDVLIQAMIDAATEWGEKQTGRDFRSITWDLFLDCFEDRIKLRRDPVVSITTVKHLVNSSLVTVDNTIYYLKKLVQASEILLFEGQSWPTDTDNREQAIEIRFVTEGFRCQESIINAIKRSVAFWYTNRGDCDSCDTACRGSGVKMIYDQFKIQRF